MGIRAYFSHLADQTEPQVAWLDATEDQSKLLRMAEAIVRKLVHGRIV